MTADINYNTVSTSWGRTHKRAERGPVTLIIHSLHCFFYPPRSLCPFASYIQIMNHRWRKDLHGVFLINIHYFIIWQVHLYPFQTPICTSESIFTNNYFFFISLAVETEKRLMVEESDQWDSWSSYQCCCCCCFNVRPCFQPRLPFKSKIEHI